MQSSVSNLAQSILHDHESLKDIDVCLSESLENNIAFERLAIILANCDQFKAIGDNLYVRPCE